MLQPRRLRAAGRLRKGRAAKQARGSADRLFALIFGVGTVVTVFLSNDATAVVLTPAVYAAAKAAKAEPLPTTGPKFALTGGLDYNDHPPICGRRDKVHGAYLNTVLLHTR